MKAFLLYVLLIGVPAVVILFWNPFSNLTEWQMAVFAVIFGLALVGIHHMIEQGKK